MQENPMFARIRQAFSKLRSCNSGNAMLMVALGMPALIGGSGLAVDTSQWYLWKREMQFAVDQAALAGAWARSECLTRN
jgi:Flp pilus assembly protein TadG